MSVVVDASVIVSLVVADERQTAVLAHMEEWLAAGEQLHARFRKNPGRSAMRHQ